MAGLTAAPGERYGGDGDGGGQAGGR